MAVEAVVFAVCALICLGGGMGVVLARHPVHSALSLIATLFGVAVLFIAQAADFLAAVQVIVYAGAIVVLFLFVIMLLGVDRAESLEVDPLPGQRVAAVVVGLVIAAVMVPVVVAATTTGARGASLPVDERTADVTQIGRLLFTDYLFAFEATSVLLVIAVVGAVWLSRARGGTAIDDDEPVTTLEPLRSAHTDGDRADGDRADGDEAGEAGSGPTADDTGENATDDEAADDKSANR